MTTQQYSDGSYRVQNPSWHVEDSDWKARQVLRMLRKHDLSPRTFCEVGCGAGEILHSLQSAVNPDCILVGYDISPEALELALPRANARLQFRLGSASDDAERYDVLLLMDVIEHVEDYFEFLRDLRGKAQFKILHVPLDLSVQSVLRGTPIARSRNQVGHLHYFTKETALCAVRDAGYEVIDYFYTGASTDLPTTSLKVKLARLPRRFFFRIDSDWTVRVLGGYSLLILAR